MACGAGEAGEGSQGREAARWSVDPVPVVDIAGTASNGDLVFEYASGATRLSSGAIVIADGMGTAVRFFDASGHPIRTVGREGRGPGEFSWVSWLGQCGVDTVYAWDAMQHRVTVLDSAGTVVNSYRLPADPTAAPPVTVNCSRAGVFALIGRPLNFGVTKLDGEWVRYNAILSLADVRGRPTLEIGEVTAGEANPLVEATTIAVSHDRVYVGTKDSAFVDVYSLSGQLMGVLPVRAPERTSTQRHHERVAEARVVWYAIAAEREQMKQMLLGMPMPEWLPPYSDLFADPEGMLWVLLSVLGDLDTRLRAIGADGHVVADVQIPLELRVFEIGLDYVLGAYEDESGEPHVAMYRMHRGR